jgi:hypothetical protein
MNKDIGGKLLRIVTKEACFA